MTVAPSTNAIDIAARIAEHHQAEEIDGVLIDAQTAHAIMAIYRSLSPRNKLVMESMHVAQAALVAWRLIGSR